MEINTESDIESAQISFYLKDGFDVNDYVVLWFDEDKNKWGNVEGHEFMTNPRDIKDFLNNQEAQDAYKEIEKQMKTK